MRPCRCWPDAPRRASPGGAPAARILPPRSHVRRGRFNPDGPATPEQAGVVNMPGSKTARGVTDGPPGTARNVAGALPDWVQPLAGLRPWYQFAPCDVFRGRAVAAVRMAPGPDRTSSLPVTKARCAPRSASRRQTSTEAQIRDAPLPHGLPGRCRHLGSWSRTDCPEHSSFWRVAWTSFGVIPVAEFGDLTQIATATLAARYHNPLSVLSWPCGRSPPWPPLTAGTSSKSSPHRDHPARGHHHARDGRYQPGRRDLLAHSA